MLYILNASYCAKLKTKLLLLYLLQHRIYKNSAEVPDELTDILPKETYEKARIYGLDKSSFSIVQGSFSIINLTVSEIKLILVVLNYLVSIISLKKMSIAQGMEYRIYMGNFTDSV